MNKKEYKSIEEFKNEFFPKTVEQLKIKNMTPEEYGNYIANKNWEGDKNE